MRPGTVIAGTVKPGTVIAGMAIVPTAKPPLLLPPLAKPAIIRLYGLLRDVLRGVRRVLVCLVRLRGLGGRQA